MNAMTLKEKIMTNEKKRDDREILPDIADDPISAAEKLRDEIGGVRKKLYRCLGKAVAISEVLEADNNKWTEFKAHVVAEELHVANSILRTVMCFIFQARKPKGPAYERACCYTRALAKLREDPAFEASAIADLIRKRGGIEELYAEAKATGFDTEIVSAGSGGSVPNFEDPVVMKSPRKTKAALPAPTATNSTGLSAGGTKTASKDENEAANDEPRKYTKAWCEQRLILEITSTKLHRILKIRDRQRGSLEFVRCGRDSAGFKVLNVESLILE